MSPHAPEPWSHVTVTGPRPAGDGNPLKVRSRTLCIVIVGLVLSMSGCARNGSTVLRPPASSVAGTGARPSTTIVSFNRIVIDNAPDGAVVEKALADLNGDGKLDAIVGEERSPSQPHGGGIFWYDRSDVIWAEASMRAAAGARGGRREFVSAIGGFDVRLGPGTRTRDGDDLDLLLRILRAGGHVGYQPRSLVRHAHRRELSALRRQVFGYGVGASAMLSKWWWKDRAFRRRFLRTLATDRTGLVGPCAPAQDEHSPQPPPSLAALQLLGNAIGPLMWLVAGTGTDGVELAAANEEDAGREPSKAMQ